MTIDSRAFRKTLGCFASGVTVVTTIDPNDGNPQGVTVSAFSSLSLDPPLVLFCLGNATASLPAFRANGRFVINVLAEGQRDLSLRFAGRGTDKWAGVEHGAGLEGLPVLAGCLAHLQCSLHQVVEGGDHTIFIGRVEQLDHSEGGAPLVYFRGAYMDTAPSGL